MYFLKIVYNNENYRLFIRDFQLFKEWENQAIKTTEELN